MSHVYCPECGFQNPEAANYCSKCGALLHTQEGGETTQAFTAEDRDEVLERLVDVGIKGPALVVRSGGGRSGETFTPQGDRTPIGRSPECDIFLDDVTVSRRHAIVAHKEQHVEIEMSGNSSLSVRQTAPIVSRRSRFSGVVVVAISARGRSAGTCRSGARRRPRAAPTRRACG